MTIQAKGTTEVQSWEEKTWEGKAWNEVSGARLTHAVVSQDWHGDIAGTSQVHFQMFYPDEQSSTFIGLQQITGKIGDKSGSFVIQINGAYADGQVKATYSVVPGSAAGELEGLQGEGSFVSVDHKISNYTFDYDLG